MTAVLADLVLVLHAGFVAFVVFGLVYIVAGSLRGRPLARDPWFRGAHLAAIGIVVAEAWSDVVCPLTSLERWLRALGGGAGAVPDPHGGFIEQWLHRLLYYDAPPWVFTAAYSLFGLAVVACWVWFPPRRRTVAGAA